MTRRLLVLLFGLVAALSVARPALAATSTVTLGQGGPSPATVTVQAGDTVVFSNTDGTSHALKSTSKNWSLSVTVKANTKSSVVFSKAGTFDYSDTYDNVLGISTTATGHVVVPATQPTATPTSSPTAKPSASASTRPSASASASASATSSGVAIPPPITGAVIPTPAVTTSTGPQPQVALAPTPGTTTEPSPTPAVSANYGDPAGLVQKSPRGFGLPVALAVVAAVGVVTLLVRFLLATPEAERPVR